MRDSRFDYSLPGGTASSPSHSFQASNLYTVENIKTTTAAVGFALAIGFVTFLMSSVVAALSTACAGGLVFYGILRYQNRAAPDAREPDTHEHL
jgi:hypothetical protein